jgi:hypothetical protein
VPTGDRKADGGWWDRPDTDGPPGLHARCPTQAVNWPPDANPVERCGNATALDGGTVILRSCKPLAFSYRVVDWHPFF